MRSWTELSQFPTILPTVSTLASIIKTRFLDFAKLDIVNDFLTQF